MPSVKTSPNRSNPSTRNHNSRQAKTNNTPLIIVLAIVGICLVGGLLWWALSSSDSSDFKVENIERYLSTEPTATALNDEVSVYIDFSNGMNSAFSSDESRVVLRDLINKLSGKQVNADFFSLANNNIQQLDGGQVTGLYNTIMNPKSFNNQSAPIEKSLQDIVAKKNKAVLITDFEEYNNGVIQQAAYAKDYFIQWLKDSFNITFYMWDYTEGSKNKKIFVAVFDDQANILGSQVAAAISQSKPQFISMYVLGGKDFAFPMATDYLAVNKGGNYHDENGKDIITQVIETGGELSFKNFNEPIASASGHSEPYSPLSYSYGSMAQFYPMGSEWELIVSDYKAVKETNQDVHILSKLYVDFAAQNGYKIKGIEARVFNARAISDSIPDRGIDMPQIFDMFVAETIPSNIETSIGSKWNEIVVDFDERFDGKRFPAGMNPSDLYRINIVISNALPWLDDATEFFGWEGNNSLVSSVLNTLQSDDVNPEGRVLMSYFLKTI